MITKENLEEANKQIDAISVKGKNYAMVNQRVKAFRSVCPNGSITTEIVALDDGIVTMMATVKDDDGKILATGTAYEKESASMINKTSYIENCETSAVGRALGFAGFGIDGSMASAEEVATAIINQNKPEINVPIYIDEKTYKTLAVCAKKQGKKPSDLEALTGVTDKEHITYDAFRAAMAEMGEI